MTGAKAPQMVVTGTRAIVVDWAGAVIDFGSIGPIEAQRTARAHHGAPISEAEACVGMGRAKRDHMEAILALPRVQVAWAHIANPAIGPGVLLGDVCLLEAGGSTRLTEAAASDVGP